MLKSLRGLGATVVAIVVLNILGKLLGFLRIQQISAQMGVSFVADALLLALTIMALWEAVAISGACLPVLTSRFVEWERQLGTAGAVGRTTHVGITVVAIAAMLSLSLLIGAPWLVGLIAPGMEEDARALFAKLVTALSLSPVFATLALVLAAITRLHGGAVYFAMTAIIVNGISLPVLLLGPLFDWSAAQTAFSYCLAISIAAVLAALFQWRVLRDDLRSQVVAAVAELWARSEESKTQFKASLAAFLPFWPPLIAAVAAQEINSVVDLGFASTTRPGAIAAYGYADRLTKIIAAVLIAAIFVVLDPRWSRLIHGNPNQRRPEQLSRDIFALLMVATPCYALLCFKGADAAQLVFGYGAMQQGGIEEVASLVSVLAAAGGFAVLSLVCVRILTFTHRTGRILAVNLGLVPANFVLNSLLVERFGLLGVAFATLVVFASQFILMFLAVRRSEWGSAVALSILGPASLVSIALVILVAWLAAGLTRSWHPVPGIGVSAVLTLLVSGACYQWRHHRYLGL